MRLGRFRANGDHRTGVFENGRIRDVTEAAPSFRDTLAKPELIRDVDGPEFDLQNVRLLPPITERNTVYCAALNYRAHAEEAEAEAPSHPFIFMKLPQTLVGHNEPISYHSRVTNEIDYEAELAAAIGSPTRHVTVERALNHVVGYSILNDTSARDLQFSLTVGDETHIDWFSGKAMTDTTPFGPFVVVDEIDDPQDLRIRSLVNGETMQDSNTSLMIHSVAELVSFLSSRIELKPGDVIATGTPAGVGAFQDALLTPGDQVEVEIEGIGKLSNTVKKSDD